MASTIAHIQNQTHKTLMLTPAERDAISNTINSVPGDYGRQDFHEFYHDCRRAAGSLPARLTRAIFDFQLGRHAGYLLIKGLPLPHQVPPTPAARGQTWNQATLHARKAMCVVLSALGHIYNFTGKKHPDYIDDVFPIFSDRHEQLGTNQCFLEWHVEDGFHPAKADLVSLYCLRGDSNAKTYLCHARDLDLDPHHRQQLEQPNFLIQVDPTFVDGSQAEAVQRCTVLSPGQDPEIIYDPAYMTATSDAAEAALQHLRDRIEQRYQAITLEPGDLLVFDNRRSVHARSAYSPRFDGSDRWLLRGLVLESYWKTRESMQDLAHGFITGNEPVTPVKVADVVDADQIQFA
ncbi:TauD/TfdA family dioxygenase [Chitinivorax sp. B]|uniref:TauD/TfdA family dioxygenase n=1 Tax=Chitinivorax sp. B TaxID=2502235 RepID=UPI0010F72746|nr:TauD/TfdA family dioxygenase [Chitinivorax sp. B]